MLLKVVPQFSSSEENSERQLLIVRVALLGLGQNLAYVVSQPLYRVDLCLLFVFHHHHHADNAVCCCKILAQGLIGLIEYSYQQLATSFPEAHLKRTLGLSVLGPE
jgi:hypothetical protein